MLAGHAALAETACIDVGAHQVGAVKFMPLVEGQPFADADALPWQAAM